jgi:hypothetical protein
MAKPVLLFLNTGYRETAMPTLVPAAMSSKSPPAATCIALPETLARYWAPFRTGCSNAVPARLAPVAHMSRTPAISAVLRFGSMEVRG